MNARSDEADLRKRLAKVKAWTVRLAGSIKDGLCDVDALRDRLTHSAL